MTTLDRSSPPGSLPCWGSRISNNVFERSFQSTFCAYPFRHYLFHGILFLLQCLQPIEILEIVLISVPACLKSTSGYR